MLSDEIKKLKLTAKMLTALECTEPGDIMKPGPTRAALMRRGLVFSRSSRPDRFGRLSPNGERLRSLILAGRSCFLRP